MAVDLFQRIVLKGAAPGMDVSSGPLLASDNDHLIQLLEQQSLTGTQEPRVAPAEPFIGTVFDQITDLGVWFLTESMERTQIFLEAGDITDSNTAEESTELWFLHHGAQFENGGISKLKAP